MTSRNKTAVWVAVALFGVSGLGACRLDDDGGVTENPSTETTAPATVTTSPDDADGNTPNTGAPDDVNPNSPGADDQAPPEVPAD